MPIVRKVDFRVVEASIRGKMVVGRAVLRNVSRVPLRAYVLLDGVTVFDDWSVPHGQVLDQTKAMNTLSFNRYPGTLKPLLPGGEVAYNFSVDFPGTRPRKSFVSTLRFDYDSRAAIGAYGQMAWPKPWPDPIVATSNAILVQIENNVPIRATKMKTTPSPRR